MPAKEEKYMSLGGHLSDLRRVIIVSFVAVVVSTMIMYFALSEHLFQWITRPVAALDLPLITISLTEAFMTKIKICVIFGLMAAFPVILLQLWSFIAPALHPHERRYIYIMVPLSILLFAAGVAFSYLVVLSFVTRFLLVTASESLTVMVSVSKYVSFLLSFLLPFGLIFQMPLVVLFLTWIELLTPGLLIKFRKYAVLAIFVIAAVLTPPDILSQFFMAGPMLLLYEVSILISRVASFRKRKRQKAVLSE